MMDRVCVVVFALYNVLCAVTLAATPRLVEERFYGTSPDVATPQGTLFLLHSIASFHGYLVVLSVVSLVLFDARTRRVLALLGCLLNAYDAASQLFFWGARCWQSPDQVYVDVGAPTFVALAMLVAALTARDNAAKKPTKRH